MITLIDLIDIFGEDEILKRSDKNKTKTINHEFVERAIQASVNEGAGYLRSVGLVKTVNGVLVYVYTDIPRDLIQKLADVARYYMYDQSMTKVVEARYIQAIDWFKQIQKNPKMLTGVADDENNEQTNNQLSGGVWVMPNLVPSIYE